MPPTIAAPTGAVACGESDPALHNKENARSSLGEADLATGALLRKWTLTIARSEPSKSSMQAKLKRAGWDNAFLATLLTNKANT